MKTIETELISNANLRFELIKAKSIIDQFIRSCSHNLRAPMTSIEGLVNVVKHTEDREEVDQCLDRILSCTSQMKSMLEKLDQYTSNLDREFIVQEIEPELLLEKVLNDYQEEIELGDINISTNVSKHVRWLGDEHSQYLIFKQLVENAIQFSDHTKAQKELVLNIDVQSDHVAIQIVDNGVGIVEEEKKKIYLPFHRSSVQSRGQGFGLFLVKSLIEKLKATIKFQSVEQVGTSVFLSLPNYH